MKRGQMTLYKLLTNIPLHYNEIKSYQTFTHALQQNKKIATKLFSLYLKFKSYSLLLISVALENLLSTDTSDVSENTKNLLEVSYKSLLKY